LIHRWEIGVFRAEGRAGTPRPALPRGEGITLGPKLPAFISPAVLDVRQEFELKPSTSMQADRARMVGA